MAPQKPSLDENAWPAVGWEDVQWIADPDSHYSRRQREAQTGPYQRSIPHRIARATPHVSATVTADVDEATAEIARFDSELGPEVAPYGALLLRSEAAASSRIEHLTASARAIATAEAEGSGTANAEEILANTRSMEKAINLADHVGSDAILSIHRALMAPQHPDIAGAWRRQQVWIGRGDAGPRHADFVPPAYEAVPTLIDDLIQFVHRTDIAVLVQAAAAHAQFETIHPFSDGNGRTGRALIHVILRNKGLTTGATVPISAGLLVDTQAYFDALGSYRDGDLEPIVSMMAGAALRAVRNSRRLVADLHDVRESWNERINARRQADAWRLADLLISQPVVTTELIATELHIARSNTARAIAPLVQAGVLVGSAGAKRGIRIWRAAEILDQLDDFAARAGRRNWS